LPLHHLLKKGVIITFNPIGAILVEHLVITIAFVFPDKIVKCSQDSCLDHAICRRQEQHIEALIEHTKSVFDHIASQ
jgi:hypothetical protein